MEKIKLWLEDQSPAKLVIAGVFIIGIPFFIFSQPRGAEYQKLVAAEVEIAKKICIEAFDYILAEPERLKITGNKLNDIPVNGEIPRLKYVEYPRVLFLHNGYANINTMEEFYCTFRDPRGTNEYGSSSYFYDYNKMAWVARARTRR